ncbi:MAG: hypothetical protein IPM02_07735 [Betaproteobacteria bacterium]|nr:hypothetical protein [Betaproteobacteria bacterium]
MSRASAAMPGSAQPVPRAGWRLWLGIAAFALGQFAPLGQVLGQASPGAPSSNATNQVTPRTLSRLLLVAAAHAGNRVVAVGEHGSVVYSDDQGQSWRRGPTPRRAMLTAVVFVDDKFGWAVGHDGQILASQDGGTTWLEQRYKPEDKQPLFAVHFNDRERGFAVGAYGLFLNTTDGGKTWTPATITEEDKHFYAVAGDGAGRLAIAAEAGTLLTSADQGRTWEPATSPYKGSFFGLLTAADGGLLTYGLRGNIFKSGDFGKTWTPPAVTEGTATLQGGARLPGGEIVLAGSAGAVLSSRDNGASFQRVAGLRAMTYSAVLPTAAGALLFGEAGVVPYVPAAGAGSVSPSTAAAAAAPGAAAPANAPTGAPASKP